MQKLTSRLCLKDTGKGSASPSFSRGHSLIADASNHLAVEVITAQSTAYSAPFGEDSLAYPAAVRLFNPEIH